MIEDVEITRVSFPEGDFDFVWCRLSLKYGCLSFEQFIGVGIDYESIVSEWDFTSNKYRTFDDNVFAYAGDWDEFEDWVNLGGKTFTILDYEKKPIGLSLG